MIRISQDPTKKRAIVFNPENEVFEEYYVEEHNFIAERLHRRLNAEKEWFERIITHNPTVGSFYETLIRNAIREISPTNNKVSTGFVLDAERNKHSKQIDILTYDDSDRNVVLRSEDFVIVYPGCVNAISEVKKTLTSTNLKKVIKSTFFDSAGAYSDDIYGIQRIHIFAFDLKGSINSIFNSVYNSILELIGEVYEEEKVYPVSTLVLPYVYFLNESYLIETYIDRLESINYKVRVELHETTRFNSLGNYLSAMLRQNKKKVSRYESNYLSENIRKIAKVTKIVDRELLLYKKISYSELITRYKVTNAEVAKYVIDESKPICFILPVTLELENYTSIVDLFKEPGVGVEMLNTRSNKHFVLGAEELLITTAN